MDTVIEMLETNSELLSLISNSNEHEDKGLTSKEIAATLGWGEKKTLRRINELIALGKIDCVMTYRKYITGIYNRVPIYIVKTE